MSSDSGIEPEAQENEKETLVPAPKAKRILAFAMDFVLLLFVSALLYIYIPKLHGQETEAEFVRYTSQLSESFLSSQAKGSNPDQELITRFSEFTKRMNYEYWMTISYILYFFIGEFAFNGKSLGKATFSLQTVPKQSEFPINRIQLLIRSILKGISCSSPILGGANLLFFIFDRKHRCLHDLASSTTTIQT